MSETPLLQVTNLTKTFDVGGQRLFAVDDVSLDVRAGETVGLVGESGSGKSTFGRSAIRLDEPDSGTVTFDGTDITHLGPRALREVHRRFQMVFQNPATCLDPLQRIGASLEEPLRIHRIGSRSERSELVAAQLERVGLGTNYIGRYPHELSGGQRQRVGIARALMLGPKLIVADEPTSALDLSVQAQVINLLLDLQAADDLAFLFISHDLGVVRHLSHRIAVLYLGRVVETGSTAEVLASPLHPYTAALVSGSGADGRHGRIRLTGEIPSPIDRPTGCAFRTRCPVATSECAEDVPPLAEVAPGHQVACIRPGAVEVGDAERRAMAAEASVSITARPRRREATPIAGGVR